MSWVIGAVTLPYNPHTVQIKNAADVKAYRMPGSLPLVMSPHPPLQQPPPQRLMLVQQTQEISHTGLRESVSCQDISLPL